MIQELLSSVVEVDNRTKLSHIPSNLTSSPSQSATSSPTSSSSDTTITANAANNQNNLRCPRCDSSNTKFCYYNNYNLTQPRHFCKTCRRYWTKGGALRNVPIGGGCRKTKSAVAPPSIVKSSAAMPSCTKPKTMTSLDIMGRAGPDVLLPSSPILWAGMPHSSHLLALLRASQMQQNPSFLNSVRVKEEGGGGLDANCGGMNLENFGGFPVNAGGAPLWRSTESQYPFMSNHHQVQQAPPTQSLLLSEVPTSSGIQELYQRLKSSTMGSYGGESEQFQGIVGSNVGVATSMGSGVNVASSSSVMDPIPLTGGEFGYWNPTMAWSDLSTANRAFP